MQRHTLLVPGLVLHKKVHSFQEALIFMCRKEESNFPLLGAGERIPTPEPNELCASEEWTDGAPPQYCHSPVKVSLFYFSRLRLHFAIIFPNAL